MAEWWAESCYRGDDQLIGHGSFVLARLVFFFSFSRGKWLITNWPPPPPPPLPQHPGHTTKRNGPGLLVIWMHNPLARLVSFKHFLQVYLFVKKKKKKLATSHPEPQRDSPSLFPTRRRWKNEQKKKKKPSPPPPPPLHTLDLFSAPSWTGALFLLSRPPTTRRPLSCLDGWPLPDDRFSYQFFPQKKEFHLVCV